ncbi:hypothetical protein LXM25_26165 [Dyadobacter sp. LJ53]|uniref:hypothetical protein n=1 Tax=Dyadobacter chenwenxiniae TaxID=2906456 RepID=UPI001F1A7697|nr:hypothetical protein [Dyadobacter chenwenxiniae]MCF0053585.1 hypothetical protein [Dyadobacter chenwenxiniae]
MKAPSILTKAFSVSSICLLGIALACTDHETPEIPNLPESECMLATNAAITRAYPCEFKIEKLTFYDKNGAVIGDVTPTSSEIILTRSAAKEDSNPLAVAVDQIGLLTYDVKATIRRIATPSFPVVAGYQLRYTNHVSGVLALTTPGESFQVGSSVPLAIPVGGTAEHSFELSYLYQIVNTGSGLKPTAFRGLTAFLIYNDATAAELDGHPSAIGNVAEAYVKIVTKSGV